MYMLRVLLLDDDLNLGKLLSLQLESLNIFLDISQVLSIEDANQQVVSHMPFDFWMIDHRLPGGEKGLDFVKSQKIRPPFLYGSFYLTEDILAEVKELGGTPFDKNSLITRPRLFASQVEALMCT